MSNSSANNIPEHIQSLLNSGRYDEGVRRFYGVDLGGGLETPPEKKKTDLECRMAWAHLVLMTFKRGGPIGDIMPNCEHARALCGSRSSRRTIMRQVKETHEGVREKLTEELATHFGYGGMTDGASTTYGGRSIHGTMVTSYFIDDDPDTGKPRLNLAETLVGLDTILEVKETSEVLADATQAAMAEYGILGVASAVSDTASDEQKLWRILFERNRTRIHDLMRRKGWERDPKLIKLVLALLGQPYMPPGLKLTRGLVALALKTMDWMYCNAHGAQLEAAKLLEWTQPILTQASALMSTVKRINGFGKHCRICAKNHLIARAHRAAEKALTARRQQLRQAKMPAMAAATEKAYGNAVFRKAMEDGTRALAERKEKLRGELPKELFNEIIRDGLSPDEVEEVLDAVGLSEFTGEDLDFEGCRLSPAIAKKVRWWSHIRMLKVGLALQPHLESWAHLCRDAAWKPAFAAYEAEYDRAFDRLQSDLAPLRVRSDFLLDKYKDVVEMPPAEDKELKDICEEIRKREAAFPPSETEQEFKARHMTKQILLPTLRQWQNEVSLTLAVGPEPIEVGKVTEEVEERLGSGGSESESDADGEEEAAGEQAAFDFAFPVDPGREGPWGTGEAEEDILPVLDADAADDGFVAGIDDVAGAGDDSPPVDDGPAEKSEDKKSEVETRPERAARARIEAMAGGPVTPPQSAPPEREGPAPQAPEAVYDEQGELVLPAAPEATGPPEAFYNDRGELVLPPSFGTFEPPPLEEAFPFLREVEFDGELPDGDGFQTLEELEQEQDSVDRLLKKKKLRKEIEAGLVDPDDVGPRIDAHQKRVFPYHMQEGAYSPKMWDTWKDLVDVCEEPVKLTEEMQKSVPMQIRFSLGWKNRQLKHWSEAWKLFRKGGTAAITVWKTLRLKYRRQIRLMGAVSIFDPQGYHSNTRGQQEPFLEEVAKEGYELIEELMNELADLDEADETEEMAAASHGGFAPPSVARGPDGALPIREQLPAWFAEKNHGGWWRSKWEDIWLDERIQTLYPHLTFTAFYLCLRSATSVPMERVFSRVRQVIGLNRGGLTPASLYTAVLAMTEHELFSKVHLAKAAARHGRK